MAVFYTIWNNNHLRSPLDWHAWEWQFKTYVAVGKPSSVTLVAWKRGAWVTAIAPDLPINLANDFVNPRFHAAIRPIIEYRLVQSLDGSQRPPQVFTIRAVPQGTPWMTAWKRGAWLTAVLYSKMILWKQAGTKSSWLKYLRKYLTGQASDQKTTNEHYANKWRSGIDLGSQEWLLRSVRRCRAIFQTVLPVVNIRWKTLPFLTPAK